MSDDKERLFWFALGITLMSLMWATAALLVEESKVKAGYLTHKGKTYSVVFYDELKTPEKVE